MISGIVLSYIAPQIIEKCKLHKDKQKKPWLVQLGTGTRRNITKLVKQCIFSMNMIMQENLNVLPLYSYDILNGMDWLEAH